MEPASSGVSVAPNPARGRTVVTLGLGAPARVRVSVYDVLGREVAVLAEGPPASGRHALMLDGSGLRAGVYVVRARVEPEGGAGARAARMLTERFTLVD